MEEAHSKHWILTALPQHRPLRHGRRGDGGRRRGGGADLLRQARPRAEPDRGGADRRPAAGALRIQPLPRPAGPRSNAATRCWQRWRTRATSRPAEYRKAIHSGPRPEPGPQVPGDPRPLPLRPRPAGADRQIRPQHRPLRRPQGLHDDRPRTAGTGAGSGRLLLGLLPRRRAGRRPRLGRPLQRRDRRPRLDPKATPNESQFNYAWQAHRQPGSSFKTFVLTTAIKQGIDPYTHLLRRHLAEDAATCRAAAPGPSTTPSRAAARCRSPAPPGTRSTSSSPSSTSTSAPKTSPTPPTRWGSKRRSNRCPAEAIGGLAIGVTPLEMADGVRDARRRRHPPRTDRDRPGRVPQRQGRRTRAPTRATASSPRARPTT